MHACMLACVLFIKAVKCSRVKLELRYVAALCGGGRPQDENGLDKRFRSGQISYSGSDCPSALYGYFPVLRKERKKKKPRIFAVVAPHIASNHQTIMRYRYPFCEIWAGNHVIYQVLKYTKPDIGII